jgi:hypothetical protein
MLVIQTIQEQNLHHCISGALTRLAVHVNLDFTGLHLFLSNQNDMLQKFEV